MYKVFSKIKNVITKIFSSNRSSYLVKKKLQQNFVKEFHEITDLIPNQIYLYQIAFQHESNLSHNAEDIQSNERLEFLGDAVLGLVIGDFLYHQYKSENEGFLSDIRSRMVNREFLNKISIEIGIAPLLNHKIGASSQKIKNIYGNALEAFIGAVYLDHGYKKCQEFIIQKIVDKLIDLEEIINTDSNYKSKILEWAQKQDKEITFKLLYEEKNESNMITFTSQILINGQVFGEGVAYTKKKSEQLAAKKAIEKVLDKD